MTSAPRAATLLEIEPALARMLGASATAAIGHLGVLPVLVIEVGDWSPSPQGDALALVVLDGWLLSVDDDGVIFGPQDRFDPWERRSRWTASTGVRLAVLGRELAYALREFPGVADRLRTLGLPNRVPPATWPPELRVVELLWLLARHWGTLEEGGIGLPAIIDVQVLARLAEMGEPEVASALAGLLAGGAAEVGVRGGWVLHPAAGDRREELHARVAEQLATARMVTAEYAQLVLELQAQVRQLP